MRRSLLLVLFLLLVVRGLCSTKPTDIKGSSNYYRNNAAQADVQLQETPGGSFTAVDVVNPTENRRVPLPWEHADHMLEAQTVFAALAAQGKKASDLSPDAKHQIRRILSGPQNMQFIDGRTNIAKGALFRQGLKGLKVSSYNTRRDAYTRVTVPYAVRAAEEIDKVFEANGLKPCVKIKHMAAVRSAGIVSESSPTPRLPGHASGSSKRGNDVLYGHPVSIPETHAVDYHMEWAPGMVEYSRFHKFEHPFEPLRQLPHSRQVMQDKFTPDRNAHKDLLFGQLKKGAPRQGPSKGSGGHSKGGGYNPSETPSQGPRGRRIIAEPSKRPAPQKVQIKTRAATRSIETNALLNHVASTSHRNHPTEPPSTPARKTTGTRQALHPVFGVKEDHHPPQPHQQHEPGAPHHVDHHDAEGHRHSHVPATPDRSQPLSHDNPAPRGHPLKEHFGHKAFKGDRPPPTRRHSMPAHHPEEVHY